MDQKRIINTHTRHGEVRSHLFKLSQRLGGGCLAVTCLDATCPSITSHALTYPKEIASYLAQTWW